MTAISLAALLLTLPGLAEPVKKNDDNRCGSYCLTVALKSFDRKTTLEQVETSLGEATAAGYSMDRLEKTARTFGMKTTVALTSLENLKWRKSHFGERFACLTLIRNDHYVLLTDIQDSTVSTCDPPRIDVLDIPVFDHVWSGQVLLMSDVPLTSEEDVVRSLNRWRFARLAGFGLLGGLVSAVALLKIFRGTRNGDSK